MAVYTCNDGYIINGDETITCQENEEWSGSAPACMYVNCGDPGDISNGNKNGATYHYGAVVSYSCDTGYDINGSQMIQCQADGMWNGTVPSCIAQCLGEPLINPIHGSKNPDTNSTFLAGAVVTFSCDDPYVINGSPVVICQEDGQWSDTAPHCLKICDSLVLSENVLQDPSSDEGFVEGDSVTLSCANGYTLDGESVVTCTSSGEWSNTLPVCLGKHP